ncbi:viperin family antiviral radical SAM protein [Flavicella sediminum]|uniref:viperin family antiviral radical SAM protein n=1 Tax=Flavicella sediminum TaxID=2585141 RepID=UPI001122DD8C|nr:viperin family antiviral radical SAM protein [Flavicella sediminum]
MKTNEFIPSVNFHLWEPCNMKCGFCFATFQDVKQTILPKGHLPKEEAIKVIEKLAEKGFEKITFAGGEPTICPWISELIKIAKKKGMTTMIVTNGSKLTDKFLKENSGYLDWIAISIDSLNESTNRSIGRTLSKKKSISKNEYREIIERVRSYSYRLKINTVVNRYNFEENMIDFILKAKPERWKVLQSLRIENQNDDKFDEFEISQEEFNLFIENHKLVETIVPESNDQITGSYVMIDPAGRFFDNTEGTHMYSKPINEVGVNAAMSEMKYDFEKFMNRGGVYNWNVNTQNSMNKITLSGGVASGKSTVGKLIAQKLNFQFISIGNKTREVAKSNKMSIVEFQKMCLMNPELDKKIDSEFANECNASDNLVIDYRLGFYFINESFNVFFKVSEDEAIKRLKKSVRTNETFHTVNERNNLFKNQFLNTYDIDVFDENNYDLIIEVDHKRPEQIADEIIEKYMLLFSRNGVKENNKKR